MEEFEGFLPKSLRESLLDIYRTSYIEPKNVKSSADTGIVEPVELQFSKNLESWLLIANQPYHFRSGGIWYAKDYVAMHGVAHLTKNTSINFMAPNQYWNVGVDGRFEENVMKFHTPSEMLGAFFQGPTIAECASVMQACMYRAIEDILGTAVFNQHFGKSITPFLITPILFNPIYSVDSEISLKYKHIDPRNAGNPLYYLFEEKFNVTDQDVQPGDIIYLKGVDKYAEKHLEGSSPGWNLLCVGKNFDGDNLYLGFGPNEFDTPKTYGQVKKRLIDGYNQTQSYDTKERIRKFERDQDHEFYAAVKKAESLKLDKVNYDYPIDGITHAIKIDPDRLKYFITERAKFFPLPWHSAPFMASSLEDSKELKSVRTVTSFSMEDMNSCFGDYEVTNETQEKMLASARKFANAVVLRQKEEPIGLVMTGLPGIGKTHLCVATAKFVAKAGGNVLFIDSHTVGNTYQQLCENNSGEDIGKSFDKWIGEADLIVFDDLNCKYGLGDQFLKQALKYIFKCNKAILISSNKSVNLKGSVPDYIGNDICVSDNFLVLVNLEGTSYRQKWCNEIASEHIAKMSESEKINFLARYTGDSPAAILVESGNEELASFKQVFLNMSDLSDEKVKLVGPPYIKILNPNRKEKTDPEYISFVSPDYYMHDDNDYEVFVMQVKTDAECRHLLKLITKIYSKGKRLIVIADNQEMFEKLLEENLSFCADDKQRLTDRVQHLFLEDVLVHSKIANRASSKGASFKGYYLARSTSDSFEQITKSYKK